MKPAAIRKGTRKPRERNKRRGATIEELPPERSKPKTAQERLAARQAGDSREFVAQQTRQLAALADEIRMLRAKAQKRGRSLRPEELLSLRIEAQLRSLAVKAAVGNRNPLDDLGVDRIETYIAEDPCRPPTKKE